MIFKKKQHWLWFALVAAGFDAVFKILALRHLPETLSQPSLIALVLHKNPGIAFNIDLGFSLVLITSFLILGWLLIDANHHWQTARPRSIAALIIVIGALGNLVDRAVNQFTTDYLYVLSAVINLSDLIVILGVFLFFRYTKTTTG